MPGRHSTLLIALHWLVALHVAGAVYGELVQRTGVLSRMLSPPS